MKIVRYDYGPEAEGASVDGDEDDRIDGSVEEGTSCRKGVGGGSSGSGNNQSITWARSQQIIVDKYI